MSDRPSRRRRLVRSPQDAGAGLFLLALAAVALWQSAGLAAGALAQFGPAMVPRGLAVGVGLCGLALLASALVFDGGALERWALRGPLMILGAALAFGVTVRPLGLAVAGPLAIIGGALASRDSRWVETALFGVVMTAFCLVLFKVVLGLPIPVAPWLIGY
jgi:putative tricarboxylic transport membrane protein